MTIYGYMRVSTDKQDHQLQRDALIRYGCDEILDDTISGTTTKRPALDELLEKATAGDKIVVWRLDRLGRSLIHLVQLVNWMREHEIDLVSLTEHIDTSTAGGRFIFSMFASFAQYERDTISERTSAAMQVAKDNGVKLGAPRQHTPEIREQICRAYSKTASVRATAEQTGVPRSTVSDILKKEMANHDQ